MTVKMMIKEEWITALALWFALAGVASAHPPYVEPWMHGANVSISGILGFSTALLLRNRIGVLGAIGVGLFVFLICGFGGWILSIMASM